MLSLERYHAKSYTSTFWIALRLYVNMVVFEIECLEYTIFSKLNILKLYKQKMNIILKYNVVYNLWHSVNLKVCCCYSTV